MEFDYNINSDSKCGAVSAIVHPMRIIVVFCFEIYNPTLHYPKCSRDICWASEIRALASAPQHKKKNSEDTVAFHFYKSR